MRPTVLALVIILVALAGRADAYPQFQLSRDTVCTACHISPSGGGLLVENGINTADVISKYGTAPEFMYGKIEPPDWLTLGGDLRGLAGYFKTPQQYLLGLPMQADLYGHAAKGNLSATLTLGFRPHQVGNEAATSVWAREHYVTWQSKPGERDGLWIRAGHLMPVFGLRFVEHPIYTRRFGGTPLMSERYGASFSVVNDRYEAHVSGFIKANPIIDAVNHSNGLAAYAEYRLGEHTQVGGGAMVSQSDLESVRYRATATAKQYLPTPGLLLQAEIQYSYYEVAGQRLYAASVDQLMGYLMASYSLLGDSVLVDVGLGHYDENLRVHAVDRDCVELNAHFFATSHIELLLVSRLEMVGKGDGGPSSGWAAAQLHYRL